VPLSTWGLQRFGGKRLWIFSLAVFLAGSVGSSLAWDVGSLIGWRVVQGIGGGLMLPLMTTLVFQAAGGKSLGGSSPLRPTGGCGQCRAATSAKRPRLQPELTASRICSQPSP
jgi:MFS family permease